MKGAIIFYSTRNIYRFQSLNYSLYLFLICFAGRCRRFFVKKVAHICKKTGHPLGGLSSKLCCADTIDAAEITPILTAQCYLPALYRIFRENTTQSLQKLQKPIFGRIVPEKSRTPAKFGIDRMIQEWLLTGEMIQRIVKRQHIFPGPVEVRNLPPSMGLGQPQLSRLLEIFRNHPFGYSNVLKCAVESVQKYRL